VLCVCTYTVSACSSDVLTYLLGVLELEASPVGYERKTWMNRQGTGPARTIISGASQAISMSVEREIFDHISGTGIAGQAWTVD
jgi:hypothetical protein